MSPERIQDAFSLPRVSVSVTVPDHFSAPFLTAFFKVPSISAADDSGLMLLARKDGRIIYVPLDGSGDDPESPEDGKKDPCDHDASGSGGGVVAGAGDDAIPHGGGVAAGGGGGVSPGSATDTHTGDDDCNCN